MRNNKTNKQTNLPKEKVAHRDIIEDEKVYTSLTEALRSPKRVAHLKLQGISAIPKDILRLTNLRTLDLSHNTLTNLPAELTQLQNLETLDLYSIKIGFSFRDMKIPRNEGI